jgi:hypothetical protein
MQLVVQLIRIAVQVIVHTKRVAHACMYACMPKTVEGSSGLQACQTTLDNPG